ncbi:MAG: UDP-N-acetylmuramate--L-alanine ligase [Lachnospiraceae bacterium]|nr:UDP-N-acetylmuramate--L-alanine ligase [Lachnospiraceae bacterium]
MYHIDFNKTANLHFIGIGGISMSGFAELLLSKGFHITGSDSHDSDITEHLEKLGIQILYGQKASNIPDNTDLVVYTAAIADDNPELVEAKRRGIPTMVRADMIGQIMKNYSNAIAVSGTHGKTTVTSMLSHIYISADTDPTISVGAILDVLDGNIRVGNSPNWIMEACEYTNSFLSFSPTTEIILNIEEDHLDFFKDINDIRNSFKEFANLLPNDGLLVINGDIDNYAEICPTHGCNIVTYSISNPECNYYADNISYNNYGCGSFDLYVNGKKAERVNLNVTGIHNIGNSLAAIAVAYTQGLDHEKVLKGLEQFRGADRRFQKKGEVAGITIIDDYAHHPSEIKATLAAAKNYPHKNIWCVFQPHTYTRTRAFLTEFAEALALADKVILTDIYAAREKDPGDISSVDILLELERLGKEGYYISSFDDIENFILKNCVNGDMLITMGAGDVVTIGEELLSF